MPVIALRSAWIFKCDMKTIRVKKEDKQYSQKNDPDYTGNYFRRHVNAACGNLKGKINGLI